MRTKNFKIISATVIAVFAIVASCRSNLDMLNGDGASHLSDFSRYDDCGFILSIGSQINGTPSVDGVVTALPAPITLVGQMIACADSRADKEDGKNWHAIGFSIERSDVMVNLPGQGPVSGKVIVEQNGQVQIYANNTVIAQLGSVPAVEISMPIDTPKNLKVEIQAAGKKLTSLAEVKTVPADQVQIWITP
jgi:hypothetical protein